MSDDDSIPPPLIPDPPSSSDTLYIPFLLADAPRIQLEFLTRHTALPDTHRAAIKEWLYGYNVRLMKWIHDHYGPEAVRAADALSKRSADRINENQRAAREKVERDLFTYLEKEMGRDDE